MAVGAFDRHPHASTRRARASVRGAWEWAGRPRPASTVPWQGSPLKWGRQGGCPPHSEDRRGRSCDLAGVALAGLFILDRLARLLAIEAFLRRPQPAPPERLPSVLVIHPITRGATRLHANLCARARMDYDGPVEHRFVCDRHDAESRAICRAVIEAFPRLCARIVLVDDARGHDIALKTVKLQAGLAGAQADLLVFIDDDVAPRPDALACFARHLQDPAVGAVFGLACYTEYGTPGSALMSHFVNAAALPSYIPLTYLCDPFTITGHFYGVRRAAFEAVGGFGGLDAHVGDDVMLGLRLRAAGLRLMQTPVIYEVANALPTLRDYHRQMTRWFVFTRVFLVPYLTRREALVSSFGSAAGVIPPPLLVLAVGRRTRRTWEALAVALATAYGASALSERRYLRRCAPLLSLPWLAAVVLAAPIQILIAMRSSATIYWRGQRLRVFADSAVEVLAPDAGRREGERP